MGNLGGCWKTQQTAAFCPRGWRRAKRTKDSPHQGKAASPPLPHLEQHRQCVCSEGLPWSTAISIPWVVERGEEGERQTGAGGKDGEEEEKEGNEEEEEEEEEEIFFSVAILNVKSESTQERQARKYMQDIEHAPF